MKKVLFFVLLLAGCITQLFAQQLPIMTDNEARGIENNLPTGIKREAATRQPGQFNVLILPGEDTAWKQTIARYLARKANSILYKVDMSDLIGSKFSVTKARLDSLFEAVKDENFVLFFEEGAALFGRRTGVLNAHDRYDNQGTNYFLSLVYRYRIPIIISVKTENNINPLLFEKFVRLHTR